MGETKPMNAKFMSAILLTTGLMAVPAVAEWKPAKPIEFVVMAGKGGGADKAVRFMQGIIAEEKLGPTVTPRQQSRRFGSCRA